MKKILIFALVALLASCSEEQMKKQREIIEGKAPVKERYYKGHHYLFWGNQYLSGVIHDPDCPCHLDTLDIWVEKNDTTYRIRKK